MNNNTPVTPHKTYWYTTMLATITTTIDQLQKQTPYTPKPKPQPCECNEQYACPQHGGEPWRPF